MNVSYEHKSQYEKHFKRNNYNAIKEYFFVQLIYFTFASQSPKVILVEHSWFKNVSKGPAFQTIEYSLNDKIRIKKKETASILYSFAPTYMNFQMISMPK